MPDTDILDEQQCKNQHQTTAQSNQQQFKPSVLRRSLKGTSMEKKSNLPLPKGKENSLPRTGKPSLLRKSKLSMPGFGSLSANSSPLQTGLSSHSQTGTGSLSANSSPLHTDLASLSANASPLQTGNVSSTFSPLQHNSVITLNSNVSSGSVNLQSAASLVPCSPNQTSLVNSVISRINSSPLIGSSSPRLCDVTIISPRPSIITSHYSGQTSVISMSPRLTPLTTDLHHNVENTDKSSNSATLTRNSVANTPDAIYTLSQATNTPTESVCTPTYLNTDSPMLEVPKNTPATGYKATPPPGVQYTLSPATRTVYSTTYTLSPNELTNRLKNYERKQQNGSNPVDTSPKSSPLHIPAASLKVTSRKVPEMHNIILEKMKHNRRRAKKNRAVLRSPVIVQDPSSPRTNRLNFENKVDECETDTEEDYVLEDEEIVEVFQGVGEGSVGSVQSSRSTSRCNSHEERVTDEALELHFRNLFHEVDIYRASTVSSLRLLDHMMTYLSTSIVEENEKWKIDELSRLLDPNHDDRFVDIEQFVQVGKKWVEQISDLDASSTDGGYSSNPASRNRMEVNTDPTDSSVIKISRSWSQDREEVAVAGGVAAYQFEDHLANASFGSVEGFGGETGCYSREVELENRCSELRYQLYRQQEEYQELQKALTNAEDTAASLTGQLDVAKYKINTLSHDLDRVTSCSDEAAQHLAASRQAQQLANFLTLEVEQLKDVLIHKDEMIRDKDELLTKLRVDIDSYSNKERQAMVNLLQKEAECQQLGEQLESKVQQLNSLQAELDLERQETEDQVSKLQIQIDNKDIQLKEIKNNSAGMAVLGNQSISIHGSNILDVSVDDKVLDDMSGSGGSPTPKKNSFIVARSPTGQARGPSASSTPCRTRRGSIVDELKEAETGCEYFPSPLCGKGKGGTLVSKLQLEMVKWEEKIRRTVIEEAPSDCSGKLVTAINKIMMAVRKDIVAKVENYDEEMFEKEEALKTKVEQLTSELQSCKQQIERLQVDDGDRGVEESKDKMLEIELVESRLTEMAELLNNANRALLATTNQAGISMEGQQGTVTPPVFSNDHSYDEDLLTNWNLDLDGIELVEWNNNLSRKLIQYTKQIREDFRAGTSMSKLWLSSLHTRLEELHTETEKSRDLLLLAGESIRDGDVHSVGGGQNLGHDRQNLVTNRQPQAPRIVELETQAVQTSSIELLNPPAFPKTQGCQTSDTSNEDSLNTADQNNNYGGGGVMSWLSKLVGVTLLVLVIFTMCGGIEYEGGVFYPITYSPLRWVPRMII